jgi:ABC-type glycerol-3-phosphate transport system substrate-binding protein
MKKSFLTLLTIFLVSTLVFVLGGCKGGVVGGNTIRFMYWGDTSEIAIIKTMIAKFEKETGYTVKAERAPAGPSYMEKVLTEFAGGSAPDVLFVEVNNFKQFAQKGVLEDLTPYIAKETTLKTTDFYDSIIDRFTLDGQLFVLPRDIAPISVVYYNKTMFDEAGLKYPKDNWTWNDMLAMAKKLVKKDANGMTTQYGYVDDWPIWEAFVYSNGGSMVDNIKDPKKCIMDKKAVYEAIQFRADLINKWGVTPSPSEMTAMGGMGTADMFVSGRVAMFFSGLWKTPLFRQQIKNFDWDITNFPMSNSDTAVRAYPTGGSGYAVIKSSKNKEAAWKLVTYLAGVEGQKMIAGTGLSQPAMKKIAESPAFLDGQAPKNKKILLDAVNYVRYTPLMPEWEEINVSMIAPAFDRIWNGKDKAKDVLKKLAPEINESYFSEEK